MYKRTIGFLPTSCHCTQRQVTHTDKRCMRHVPQNVPGITTSPRQQLLTYSQLVCCNILSVRTHLKRANVKQHPQQNVPTSSTTSDKNSATPSSPATRSELSVRLPTIEMSDASTVSATMLSGPPLTECGGATVRVENISCVHVLHRRKCLKG